MKYSILFSFVSLFATSVSSTEIVKMHEEAAKLHEMVAKEHRMSAFLHKEGQLENSRKQATNALVASIFAHEKTLLAQELSNGQQTNNKVSF